MKWILVAVGVGGCPSAAPPPPLPTSPTEPVVPSTPDAARPPPIAVDAAPAEAIVEPPPRVCYPSDRSALALDGDEVRACWYGGDVVARYDDEVPPPDRCLWIARDGTTRSGEPPEATGARVSFDVDVVSVCAADGACTTFSPAMHDGDIFSAILDDTGRKVAVEIHDADGGASHLAVHDLDAPGKPQASAVRKRRSKKQGSDWAIGWLGPLLIWVELPDGMDGAQGQLWKRSGKKLTRVAKLPGFTRGWGQVGPDLYAVAGGVDVGLWDVAKGKRQRTIHVDGLLDDDDPGQDLGPRSRLVTRDGAFALIYSNRAVFVDLTTGAQSPVDLPEC